MVKQEFMQKAIALAYENVQKKGEPYGAVVVKDGEIVGTGVNDVKAANDPTAHAEIQAIREACRRLNRTDLSDCDIYASGEPCPMCLAAIYWAQCQTVYYAYPKDPSESELGSAYIYKQLALPANERAIAMEKVANEHPEMNPIDLWRELNRN